MRRYSATFWNVRLLVSTGSVSDGRAVRAAVPATCHPMLLEDSSRVERQPAMRRFDGFYAVVVLVLLGVTVGLYVAIGALAV